MGATDELLLKIIAQDEYSKEMDAARSQVDEMSDAEKDALKASEEVQEQNEDTAFSFAELQSAISLGEKALQLIGKAYAATIAKTLDYADQVRDLNRTIGTSSEESSKLIQAADDVGISAESLTGAMQAAIRKGIRPTLDGLGQLADQYIALPDQISKTKFLMDNFGRSGADLGALMEKGRAGLKAAGDEAERYGLVLSEQDVKAARDLEIAQDNLDDIVQGFITRLSTGLIPKLVEVAEGFVKWIDVASGVGTETEKMDVLIMSLTATYGEQSSVVQNLIILRRVQAEGEARLNGIIETSLPLNWQHSDALDAVALSAMADAEAQAHLTEVQSILSVGAQELTTQLIYQQASANLDAEAALQLGLQMGVLNEETVRGVQRLQALTEKYDTNRDGAIDAGEAAKGYADEVKALNVELNGIPRNITVRINYHDSGAPGTLPGSGAASGGIIGAAGGRVLTGEFGPEQVRLPMGSYVQPTSQFNQYTTNNVTTDDMGMALFLESQRLNTQAQLNQRMG